MDQETGGVSNLLDTGHIAQRRIDHFHVQGSLAHLHTRFIDDAAIVGFGVAVTPRQACTDHDAVAAHRSA